jgi:hypothetical protein
MYQVGEVGGRSLAAPESLIGVGFQVGEQLVGKQPVDRPARSEPLPTCRAGLDAPPVPTSSINPPAHTRPGAPVRHTGQDTAGMGSLTPSTSTSPTPTPPPAQPSPAGSCAAATTAPPAGPADLYWGHTSRFEGLGSAVCVRRRSPAGGELAYGPAGRQPGLETWAARPSRCAADLTVVSPTSRSPSASPHRGWRPSRRVVTITTPRGTYEARQQRWQRVYVRRPDASVLLRLGARGGCYWTPTPTAPR